MVVSSCPCKGPEERAFWKLLALCGSLRGRIELSSLGLRNQSCSPFAGRSRLSLRAGQRTAAGGGSVHWPRAFCGSVLQVGLSERHFQIQFLLSTCPLGELEALSCGLGPPGDVGSVWTWLRGGSAGSQGYSSIRLYLLGPRIQHQPAPLLDLGSKKHLWLGHSAALMVLSTRRGRQWSRVSSLTRVVGSAGYMSSEWHICAVSLDTERWLLFLPSLKLKRQSRD